MTRLQHKTIAACKDIGEKSNNQETICNNRKIVARNTSMSKIKTILLSCQPLFLDNKQRHYTKTKMKIKEKEMLF